MITRIEKGDDIKVEICEHCGYEFYPYPDGCSSGGFHVCSACGTEGCEHCMEYIRILGAVGHNNEIMFHSSCKDKFIDMSVRELVEKEEIRNEHRK